MKLLIAVAAMAAMLGAQTVVPGWRTGISALPPKPAPNTSADDVVQFERNMRNAAVYLGTVNPNADVAQWEANRAMVRRMATYLYGLQLLSGDPQLRGAVRRAQRSFDTLGFAPYLSYMPPYGDVPQEMAPPVVVQPARVRQTGVPFEMSAPDSTGVSAADKELSADLHTRYDGDAARSAGVWTNAETLRQDLESRGLGLNTQTSTAMIRMPQHFKAAASALLRNDWEGAKTHLEQAEAETEKIAKTVGR